MLSSIVNGIFSGVSIGAVLLIVALGLAIVFGLMGVINLAHGELIMLGAYTTFVVQNGFKLLGDDLRGYYIWFALPAAFVVAAIAGIILERTVIRLLYGRPLETLLATWGVSLILQQFIRSGSWMLAICIGVFCWLLLGGRMGIARFANLGPRQRLANLVILLLSGAIAVTLGVLLSGNDALASPWFGPRGQDVTAPGWLQSGLDVSAAIGSLAVWVSNSASFLGGGVVSALEGLANSLDGVYFPYARLFIIALSALCLFGVYWFLQKSAWGLRIRAVTQNRGMSACLGIPTERVDALTFALGSGLAGLAGCAVTLLGSVKPELGQDYIVDAFMVVVVGGVGKLIGSIVAALIIGIVSYVVGAGILVLILPPIEGLQPLIDTATFFATTNMAKVLVFALIVVFLQIKPAGLFPQKGRSVEV